MRTAFLALALCGPWAAPAAPPAADPGRPAGDPVEELDQWIGRFEAGRIDYDAREEQKLRGLVERLRALSEEEPERDPAVAAGLLDLAGVGLSEDPPAPLPGQRFSVPGGTPTERVRELGSREARRHVLADRAGQRLRWLTREVLVMPSRHPLPRRIAALLLVDQLRSEEGKLALLTVAQSRADELRPRVLGVLATWPDPQVDAFLVELLGRPHDRARDPHPFNLLLKRIRGHRQPLGERATELLGSRIAVMLIDPDWREASRAVELSRGMVADRSVPVLIEAMGVWSNRADLGRGSRRIQNEILQELQRISGRTIGPHPERWFTWWQAVQEGRVALADQDEAADVQRSSATFFGLRPITDRVTFVIDRSGSMDAAWGSTGHSRYEEAVEQMVLYLQAAGEGTHFNVVLFSSETILSSRSLVPASADRLEAARRSILSREPEGGTFLKPGIRQALAVGSDGRVDLERLEADTVVVLCDGVTAEGPGWVPGFLERVAEARVQFHCVLIGSQGDGTLEALARGTGGEFLRIGG